MDPRPLSAGLSSTEAAARLNQYGPNQLKPARQRAILLQFLAHFSNPLVLVLLAASGISVLTGDTTGAVIIGLIVLMSVTLDFVQEYRAGRAAEQLAAQVAVTATVLRDGKPREVPVAELVPGDVAAIYSGGCLARFTPLPPLFFGLLAGLVMGYLLLVEAGKRWFYRRLVSP